MYVNKYNLTKYISIYFFLVYALLTDLTNSQDSYLNL